MSAIFYRCSIPSIDNCMCYSFNAIDIKGICDKMKTYTRQRIQDGASYLQITAQMNVAKRKLLILIKISTACSCVSHKLLIYPIEDNCCKTSCIHSLERGNKSKDLPKIMNF